jgi:SAM-dependent methyltransferase
MARNKARPATATPPQLPPLILARSPTPFIIVIALILCGVLFAASNAAPPPHTSLRAVDATAQATAISEASARPLTLPAATTTSELVPPTRALSPLPPLNAAFDAARDAEFAAVAAANKCNAAGAGPLTPCMRNVSEAHPPPPAAWAPRAWCGDAAQRFCSGAGACFLGRCFCRAGRAGAACDEEAAAPVPACSLRSDACFRTSAGVARVSLERWTRAQWAEAAYWAAPERAGDDNDNAGDSYALFSGYVGVRPALGDVLELGCGPFTQLRSLLGNTAVPWTMRSVTLADPILVSESRHARSSFATGTFTAHGKTYPTRLLQVGAEEVGALYHDRFDTVIMQNVLEHVSDAFQVLESLYNATKPGGVIILWEPMYTSAWRGWTELGQELLLDLALPLDLHVESPDWADVRVRDTIRSRAFDMMAHPIRIDPAVFEHFATFFDPISGVDAAGKVIPTPGRRGDTSIALIGRKRASSPTPYF